MEGAEDISRTEFFTTINPHRRQSKLLNDSDDTLYINPRVVGKSRRTARDIQYIFNQTVLASYKTWIKSLELIKKLSGLCHTIQQIAADIALLNVKNVINLQHQLSASDKFWLKTKLNGFDGLNEFFPITDDIICYSIWLDRYYSPWLTSYYFTKLSSHIKGYGALLENVADILGRHSPTVSNIQIMRRDIKVKLGTLSRNSNKYPPAMKRQIQYMANDPSPYGLELLNSLKPRPIRVVQDIEFQLAQSTQHRIVSATGGPLRFIDMPLFNTVCAQWASDAQYPNTAMELVSWILKLTMMRAYSLANTVMGDADIEIEGEQPSSVLDAVQRNTTILTKWITEGPYELNLFFANDSKINYPTFTSIISTGQVIYYNPRVKYSTLLSLCFRQRSWKTVFTRGTGTL
jgi:hypothetical protein